MGKESDFVRYVSIPGDRYKVVIGYPQDEVIVAESLAIGPAEALVVALRRVVGGCIDLSIQDWCREYEARRNVVNDGAPDEAVEIVDDYIKRRAAQIPGRAFGKCCRTTANDIKSALRESH